MWVVVCKCCGVSEDDEVKTTPLLWSVYPTSAYGRSKPKPRTSCYFGQCDLLFHINEGSKLLCDRLRAHVFWSFDSMNKSIRDCFISSLIARENEMKGDLSNSSRGKVKAVISKSEMRRGGNCRKYQCAVEH